MCIECFIIAVSITLIKLKDETCITTTFVVDGALFDIGIEFLEEENEFGFVFAFVELLFIEELRRRREDVFGDKFKVRCTFATISHHTKNFH